jgi:hypothetical protein
MTEENNENQPITDMTCIDKISANIAIQIKFDPKTLNWYIKEMKLSHAEFLDSAKLKSWEWIKHEEN